MNKDINNPYRMLEKSSNWPILYDATTHYVKNLNAVFVRGVQDNDMSIVKVTRQQILNFYSTTVYCCDIFDLFKNFIVILIVSLTH